MAVITKYFVVRNGIELETVFTDKKEAIAYDNMLDAADELEAFIRKSAPEIAIEDKDLKEIAIVLAQNGPEVTKILKNVKPSATPDKKKEIPLKAEPSPKADASETEGKSSKTKRKS